MIEFTARLLSLLQREQRRRENVITASAVCTRCDAKKKLLAKHVTSKGCAIIVLISVSYRAIKKESGEMSPGIQKFVTKFFSREKKNAYLLATLLKFLITSVGLSF